MRYTQQVALQFALYINKNYIEANKSGASLGSYSIMSLFETTLSVISSRITAQLSNPQLKENKITSAGRLVARLHAFAHLELDFRNSKQDCENLINALKNFLKSEKEKANNYETDRKKDKPFLNEGLQVIQKALENGENIHVDEKYLRQFVLALLREELEKISKIEGEQAHEKNNGKYDAMLRLGIKVLEEIEATKLDTYSELYYLGSLNSRKKTRNTSSDSSHIVKHSVTAEPALSSHETLHCFMNQYLASRILYWNYNLQIFVSSSLLKSGAQSISSTLDKKISGDKETAFHEYSYLAYEKLNELYKWYGDSNTKIQVLLESTLYRIDEITQNNNADLSKYRDELKKLLDMVRIRIKAAPIFEAAVASSIAASATQVAIPSSGILVNATSVTSMAIIRVAANTTAGASATATENVATGAMTHPTSAVIDNKEQAVEQSQKYPNPSTKLKDNRDTATGDAAAGASRTIPVHTAMHSTGGAAAPIRFSASICKPNLTSALSLSAAASVATAAAIVTPADSAKAGAAQPAASVALPLVVTSGGATTSIANSSNQTSKSIKKKARKKKKSEKK